MRPLFSLLVCKILAIPSFAEDASSVIFSQAMITLQHHRINGHTFKAFSSSSLISCGLQCTKNPRCVSTNFKATQPSEKGVCELNDQGMAWPADKKDLEYEEGVIFTQYQSIEVRLLERKYSN